MLFCGLALAVTWLHPGQRLPKRDPHVAFLTLRDAQGLSPAPGLVVEGVWQLTAYNWLFGGYSALASDGEGGLVAVSDSGARLDIADPSLGHPQAVISRTFGQRSEPKELYDVESMTRDPATGQFWLGYAFRNAIIRYDATMTPQAGIRPEAMRGWPDNDGPEALARLEDGRFIVLSEAGTGPDGLSGAALLFPGDPVEGAQPIPFRLVLPFGYAPSDMAALPDGRVMLLIRRLTFPFPPRFAVKLLLADPATIREGQPWEWEELAELKNPLPLDNYEGVAVVPGMAGKVTIWLISDDNSMATQRTLLLKLVWDPARIRKKARGSAARPLAF